MKLNKENQLMVAIGIATDAHHGQKDMSGMPYILHPIHLMHQLLFDLQLATIAILHDVVEDSKEWDIKRLRKTGFSERVLVALDLLTHVKDVPYMEYIEGIAGNHDAIRVKRKDLEHNSDITRLKGIRPRDIKRMEKYHKAFLYLGEAKKLFIRK